MTSNALYDANKASVGVTYLLWFFLGLLGVHRFYLSRPISAICMMLTLGGLFVWWLLDGILIPTLVKRKNLAVIDEMNRVKMDAMQQPQSQPSPQILNVVSPQAPASQLLEQPRREQIVHEVDR